MSARPNECLSWEWHLECMEAERKGGYERGLENGRSEGIAAAREAVLAYADERLEMTRYPNKSEDITAALRVAARRIDGLQSTTRTLPDPHDSSDVGTKVPGGAT